LRYPRTRYCIRLPKVLIAELRKQGSPNQQLGQTIDSFDWNSLNFAPDIDFAGVELEQITVQTSVAGKTALVDHCRFSGKEQRLAIVQAIASVVAAKLEAEVGEIILEDLSN
jgi:hypothetical protein